MSKIEFLKKKQRLYRAREERERERIERKKSMSYPLKKVKGKMTPGEKIRHRVRGSNYQCFKRTPDGGLKAAKWLYSLIGNGQDIGLNPKDHQKALDVLASLMESLKAKGV